MRTMTTNPMIPKSWLWWFLVGGVTTMACGEESAPTCAPNEIRPCDCGDGAVGTITCSEDGSRWSECGSCGPSDSDRAVVAEAEREASCQSRTVCIDSVEADRRSRYRVAEGPCHNACISGPPNTDRCRDLGLERTCKDIDDDIELMLTECRLSFIC